MAIGIHDAAGGCSPAIRVFQPHTSWVSTSLTSVTMHHGKTLKANTGPEQLRLRARVQVPRHLMRISGRHR
jgi:hypothetical protein